MMLKKRYRVMHGWVVDIHRESEVGRILVGLRQSDGSELVLPSAPRCLTTATGHLMSVVLDHSVPARVLAVVDHTVGEGENLVRSGDYVGRGHWSTLVVSASLFAGIAAWSGCSLGLLVPFAGIFWALTSKILDGVRLRLVGRIDCLIDREYGVWSKAAQTDHENSTHGEGAPNA